MTKIKTKQEAHLRVVLRDEGKHQLLLYADLENFDLYAGPHGVQNKLRSSWHKTGKVHIHTPAGRQIGPPQVMPEDFRGVSKLYSGAYMGNDWSYKPKPDSAIRRTLIIDKHLIQRGLSCDLWAAEKGNEALIAQILAEYKGAPLELVSYVTIDWTQPQLVGVVSTLALFAWTASMRARNSSAE